MIPPNYPPLIPVGYHTIPEVLKIAGSRGDEVFSRLKEALLDGSVRAYVRSDGETLRNLSGGFARPEFRLGRLA